MATYEDRRKEPEEEEQECLYKTKVIQFLGRSIPIILQNDNGPCPLLAICNVLLLKNHLNLSLDAAEISLPKLLSLVAERLIDSNSNVQNKDAGYMENQQQNISDAIDLLPRLSTGIDVNVLFTKINDFEFTRECAIFDLLDIGLYHGWIVDPQDIDTAAAVGLKSYNTLTAELVALETRNLVGEDKSTLEEDSVDFAAATTATLGVPSPCLSRGRSFDDPPVSVSCDQRERKGDVMEAEELMRALILSKDEISISADESLSPGTNLSNLSTSSVESPLVKSSRSGVGDPLKLHTVDEYQISHQPDPFVSQDCNESSGWNRDGLSSEIISQDNGTSLSKIAARNHLDDSISKESGDSISSDLIENGSNTLVHNQATPFYFPEAHGSRARYAYKDQRHGSLGDQPALHACLEDNSESLTHLTPTDNISDCDSAPVSGPVVSNNGSPSSDGGRELLDIPSGVSSSLEGSEPIYEGEERILDSGHSNYENREPMYEGEMILAEQADRGAEGDTSSMHPKDEITQQQWELIQNFLKNNASQLTIYGLFCLQEGLKERELCVFFRNNHFSTMFKFNGELYLLVTDQGYINQPDLVWEKLNEVNGDTVFMTGNFKDFKAENQVNDQWDEQNAMTSTADYLASIDNTSSEGSSLNSDLQLAIALQQQEFEQQPQRQQPQSKQSSVSSRPRLVTGPQTPRTNTSSSNSRQDSKPKDKCVVM